MTKLIVIGNNQIANYEAPRDRRGFTVETLIEAWLDEVKGGGSGSPKTQESYRDTILKFRQYLAMAGLDLLPLDEDEVSKIADSAQLFVKMRSANSNHKGEVARNTQRQRLAALSSFYGYCNGRRHTLLGNPIDMINRPSTQAFSGAHALTQDVVIERLGAIDGDNPEDLRDLAVVSVLLFTGRRAAEVGSLRREHITILPDKRIQLYFAKAKGGKTFTDILSPEVSSILAKWLSYWYRGKFNRLPAHTPIWVDVVHESHAARPLGYQGIRGIVLKRLGTSKVHVTRHTFAYLMKLIGAGLGDIQALLGHQNIATTGLYLQAVAPDENRYSAQLTESIGLQRKRKA